MQYFSEYPDDAVLDALDLEPPFMLPGPLVPYDQPFVLPDEPLIDYDAPYMLPEPLLDYEPHFLLPDPLIDFWYLVNTVQAQTTTAALESLDAPPDLAVPTIENAGPTGTIIGYLEQTNARTVTPTIFDTLDDPEHARFTEITAQTLSTIPHALPHAAELNEIYQGRSNPTPDNMRRLQTSTIILADVFATVAALLRRAVNRANPLTYILRLPEEVLVEILYILACTAIPEVRRWNGSNLGWISMYHCSTDLRSRMQRAPLFWANVCTQLPKAHAQLRALAGTAYLKMLYTANVPAIPIHMISGSAADKRRVLSILQLSPAFYFDSVICTDLRVCASILIKWLATTGGKGNNLGLPNLRRLQLEAPPTFKDKNDVIDRYITHAFDHAAIHAPNLRMFKSTNVCFPLHSSALEYFGLEYDAATSNAKCHRPTLSNVMGLVSYSRLILKEIHLYDAIIGEDEDQLPGPIEFPALVQLCVAQNDCDVAILCLSRIVIPQTCNVHIEVKFDGSSAVKNQMARLFQQLLRNQPNDDTHRLLRVRFLGTRKTYTRTELTWTFDGNDPRSIGEWTERTKIIVLQTPPSVSWLVCLRVFAETLRALKYCTPKALILPSSQRAWEITPLDKLDSEVVKTLFIVGAVEYVWPAPRVSWAIGVHTAWDVAEESHSTLKAPFTAFIQKMRLVKVFDISRFT